jgi:hypothetical protein
MNKSTRRGAQFVPIGMQTLLKNMSTKHDKYVVNQNTARSASNPHLHLEIDSWGRLRMKLYDKRDDFNFPIVNFPAAPAYRVYLSVDPIFQSVWFLSRFP